MGKLAPIDGKQTKWQDTLQNEDYERLYTEEEVRSIINWVIRDVQYGYTKFTRKLTTRFTERQLEIFMLLVQGYSPTEIAQNLNVSLQNVSKILHKVYAKLEVQNTVEAIRECLLHGLLSVNDMKRKGERRLKNDLRTQK